MIVSIKHKGLQLFWEKNDASKLPHAYVKKIRACLDLLNRSGNLSELRNRRRYRLHQLSGSLIDYWAITVSGNDRIIFKFENGNVYLLNYLDYH
ncbi:MAG: type II toxin-antitoxin system RelE/ParE family toxin [Pseudobacter sp.]|uniref:type II toxin-antitoxin system RelE/ParE family toxin n=1 Tax=Pseudobacter sp. TaxID=2045420 RepID=UPI003F7DE976